MLMMALQDGLCISLHSHGQMCGHILMHYGERLVEYVHAHHGAMQCTTNRERQVLCERVCSSANSFTSLNK